MGHPSDHTWLVAREGAPKQVEEVNRESKTGVWQPPKEENRKKFHGYTGYGIWEISTEG